MTVNLTTTQLLVGLGGAVLALMLWRATARRTRRAARTVRTGMRPLSLTGRVLVQAGVIVGGQWVVITHQPSTALLLSALALPDLFAAYTVTKALTVTTFGGPRRRGDRW